MLNLLNPRLWLALALAAAVTFSYVWTYRHGKAIQRAETAALVAKANEASFKVTEIRQRNADEASTLAATSARDDRDRAVRVDRTLAGMRNTLDATQRHAAQSLSAASATVAAYRAIFESCTAEYRSVGEEASGHARDSLMYQRGWPK